MNITDINPYQMVGVSKLISEPEELGHEEVRVLSTQQSRVSWQRWSWASSLTLGSLLGDSDLNYKGCPCRCAVDPWQFLCLRWQGPWHVCPCRPGPCWTGVHQSQPGGASGPWGCPLRGSHPHRHGQWAGVGGWRGNEHRAEARSGPRRSPFHSELLLQWGVYQHDLESLFQPYLALGLWWMILF